nr:hypothetical protein [Tanacetum cinerariifolium]
MRKQRNEAEVSHDESEDEDHVPTPSSDPLPSGRIVKSPMKKNSLGAREDASKQRRMIKEIDQNAKIALDDETQGRTNDDEMFGVDDLAGEEVVMDTTTDEHQEQIIKDISNVEPVTTAGEIVTSTTFKDNAAPITAVTEDEITISQALAALKIELIEKRKKHFASLRAPEKRNKPPSKTQMKIQMSTYLIHMGGYKQSHLKGMSFDEIKKLFDREMRKVNDFIAMDSKAQESSTKRTAKHLEYDISKNQKVDKNVEPVIDDSEKLKKCMEIVPDDEDEVLIEATPLSSRSPTIIDYKIHKEGKKTYFKIIKADDRFKKEKLVDDMDNLLFKTLKTMFEHHVEDTIWKYQQGSTKVYPLKRNTLLQLWSDIRLQVDHDVEMAYDLIRFIRKQLMEGYTPQSSVWIHPPDEDKDFNQET